MGGMDGKSVCVFVCARVRVYVRGGVWEGGKGGGGMDGKSVVCVCVCVHVCVCVCARAHTCKRAIPTHPQSDMSVCLWACTPVELHFGCRLSCRFTA